MPIRKIYNDTYFYRAALVAYMLFDGGGGDDDFISGRRDLLQSASNQTNQTSPSGDMSSVDRCPGAPGVLLCPPGSFCPTSSTIEECPVGFYCHRGSYRPRVCPVGTCTEEGMDYTSTLLPSLGFFFAAILLVALVSKWLNRLGRRRVARRAAQREAILARVAQRNSTVSKLQIQSYTSSLGIINDVEPSNSHHDAASTVDSPNSSGKFSVEIFCGCDADSHVVLLVSSLLLLAAALTAIPIGVPLAIFHGFDFGLLLLMFSLPIGVVGACGYTLLHAQNGDDSVVPPKRSVRTSLIGALPMPSSEQPRARSATLSQRLNASELLGSLKEKNKTRVNIEVKKLGLKLKTSGQVVLAGVDGKIAAGSVTAIMVCAPALKLCFCV